MRQTGFISTGLLYLFGASVLLGSIGTIVYKLDNNGFQRGKAEVTAQVAQRDNKALKEALASLKVAQDRVRSLEDKSAKDQQTAANKYKEGVKNANAEKDSVIADLRSGTLKLRVQLARGSSNSAGNPSSETSPSGLINNGGTSGELSRETSEFLIGEASRADVVVRQLQAAQEALIKDREVCK